MKKITFTHRTINHSVNGHNNKNSLIASANHDLRIALNESQKLNHDHSMTDKNKLWVKGKLYALSENNKSSVFKRILRSTDISELSPNPKRDEIQANLKKLQNLASAIRTKFKKYKVSDDLALKFQILGDPSTSIGEVEKIKSQIQNESISRKETKLKQIDKYIQLRREIDSISKPESIRGLDLATCVQTQIYKIPNQHNVTNEQISTSAYAKFIHNFHSKYFPNHELICIIGHSDERSVIDGLEGTGDHCHAYIDGRNKSTGKYDLISEQIKVAEIILSEKNPELLKLEQDLLNQDRIELMSLRDSNKDLSKFYSRSIEKLNGRYYGRIWQEAMRLSANEMFLNKHDLDAEFHYNTRNNKSILVDQEKPIHKRKYSRAYQKTELLEIYKDELINSIKKVKENQIEYIKELNRLSDEIKNKKQSNSLLDWEIELKENEFNIIDNSINELHNKSTEFIENKITEESFLEFVNNSISDLEQNNSDLSNIFFNSSQQIVKKIDDEAKTNISEKIRKPRGLSI